MENQDGCLDIPALGGTMRDNFENNFAVDSRGGGGEGREERGEGDGNLSRKDQRRRPGISVGASAS